METETVAHECAKLEEYGLNIETDDLICVIMELTTEERRRLLTAWKERSKNL